MRQTLRLNAAVLYARVSSPDQEREGFSIPAQLKLLRAYAREQRLTIAAEFVDVETAKHAGRAHFVEMIRFLKANPTCMNVLAEKTDRLSRNFADVITLEDLRVTIHFVKEHAVLSPDSRSSDKLMHNIKVAMAKNYVDNLSEEVKKGMREKAEQGHWPSVAPIGYVNNLSTHRIEPDAVRGRLLAELFRLYATGEWSLKALVAKAAVIGLTHPRGNRRLFKSDVHRILQNPIYYGEFVWLGKRYQGSHEPLITPEIFEQVQAILRRRPRPRNPKQRHAFMGLLTCAKCGCAITAERKKGKYVYYHCTDFRGGCENTYIREERLGELLGDVIKPIQISPEIADDIATAIHGSEVDAERARRDALHQLDQRRRAVVAKQNRAYEDLIEGRISDQFWRRKSEQWEGELQVIDAEWARCEARRDPLAVNAGKILELAKQAENLYKSQNPTEQRRLLETVLSNCTFDAGTVCATYAKPFDLFVRGNETGEWRAQQDSNLRPPGS
jgi:DNA invertase Pin-like site-specific DNA recombinase